MKIKTFVALLIALLSVAPRVSAQAVDSTVPVQLVYVAVVSVNTAHPVNVSTAVQSTCTNWLIPEFKGWSYGHLTLTCTAYGYFDLTIAAGDLTGMINAVNGLIGPAPFGTARVYIPNSWPGNATTYGKGSYIVMPGGGPIDHEFIHWLGGLHAHSQSWVNGAPFGGPSDNGDRADIMGTGGFLNAFYRDYFHWFDATRRLVSVTTPQTVVLNELWSANPGLKAIKLPILETVTTCNTFFGTTTCNTRTTTQTYYVEFQPPFQGGPGHVPIHLAAGAGSTVEDIDKITTADDWSLDPGDSYCFANGTCLKNMGYGTDAVGPTVIIQVTTTNSTPAPINHTR